MEQTLITIVAFILMLGVLVFVHELGHFVVARWMGIRVEEFGIGYPPRAVTLFERDGVKYTLNWLPLGGFVRFGGEDNSLYGTGSLSAATPWRKIPVMVAGPLMNFFLAVVIFVLLFATVGVPTPTGNQYISNVIEGTPAATAGLQADDVLISLDGQPVYEEGAVDAEDPIRRIAEVNRGEAVPVVVERNGERIELMVTPGPWETEDGQQFESGLGIQYGPQLEDVSVSPPEALFVGFTYTGEILGRMLGALSSLIGGLFGLTDSPQAAGGVAGPVGIARATGEVIDQGGLLAFWRWMAVLSLMLFVMNLLPIPALDGSHIMFSLVEWVRGGKKIPPEKEALVHAIGFAALMGLMLLVTVNDVINAIQGNSVLGGG